MPSYKGFEEAIKEICERSFKFNDINPHSPFQCIFTIKENIKDLHQPLFLQIEYGTQQPHFFHIIYSSVLKSPLFFVDVDYFIPTTTTTLFNESPFHQLYSWEQHPVTNLPTRMIHQCNFPQTQPETYLEILSWLLRMLGIVSISPSPFLIKYLLL